ncbi:MAG: hydroxymethylglutaryl-CoA synthase [Francisellaceae bacterium]|nr:hydroxymethylglutaryl-CoA synthase [Francisellaceae bacterium]
MLKVGIDAISFYTSHYFLDLKNLALGRGIDPNKYYVGLGQKKMAVIPQDEDVVTMAADAGFKVLQHIDKESIDMLLFATESGVDQSKAAGIFVHQLLNLPKRCRIVELKQACYSATAAIQLALPMLRQNPKSKILLIASDIARYGLNTSGESSQGGAAVAMVLSSSPRLMSIEPISGFYTEDVMDFWRPNYREEALVEGKHSCEIYLKLIQKTWEQYTNLSKLSYSAFSRFCYHVSVPRLVEKAHLSLARLNGIKLTQEEAVMQLKDSLMYGKIVGNCYTAALYLSLISLLDNCEEDLSNQRIGLYSYGSGCVAEFFSGIIEPGYQQVLDKSYHQNLLNNRQELSLAEYEQFYQFRYPTDGSDCILQSHQRGRYRLAAFSQHKRIYETAE